MSGRRYPGAVPAWDQRPRGSLRTRSRSPSPRRRCPAGCWWRFENDLGIIWRACEAIGRTGVECDNGARRRQEPRFARIRGRPDAAGKGGSGISVPSRSTVGSAGSTPPPWASVRSDRFVGGDRAVIKADRGIGGNSAPLRVAAVTARSAAIATVTKRVPPWPPDPPWPPAPPFAVLPAIVESMISV